MELDPSGFNALRMCRGGPLLFNKNDLYIGASLAQAGALLVPSQDRWDL